MTKFSIFSISMASVVGATVIVVPVAVSIAEKNNRMSELDKLANKMKDDAIDEFIKLCEVPRQSYKTRQICDYLKNKFAEYGVPAANIHEDNYRCSWVDGVDPEQFPDSESSGNLWVDLPANDESLAQAKPFVLQGHMDMVWTTEAGAFCTHPTPVMDVEDGQNIIHTENYKSSLGADNGVALALFLTMAKTPEFKHGPIRFVITADEETGMSGAKYLGCHAKTDDPQQREHVLDNSKYLINVDNETAGRITTSTAGAVISQYSFDEPTTPLTQPADDGYMIVVHGLTGGHSGLDIGKNRANAICILYEVLHWIKSLAGDRMELASLDTPDCNAVNAIPTHAEAFFRLPGVSWDFEQVKEYIEYINSFLRNKYTNENDLYVSIMQAKEDPLPLTKYTEEETNKILALLEAISACYGVISWKDEERGIVETSNNIGPLEAGWISRENPETHVNEWSCVPFKLGVEARSCNNDHIEEIRDVYETFAKSILGEGDEYYAEQNVYYGWPGDNDSKLFDVISNNYKTMNIKWEREDPHAGLEISWFQYICPSILMSSIGPTLVDVHSVNEKFYVDTYKPVIKNLIMTFNQLSKN